MTEFYVELQDAGGTCYGTTDPWTDEPIYFEDLDEAKMYAKSRKGKAMNQRIKQLANAADILFLRDGTIMPGRGEADIQKFAELIVRECMSVAKGMRNPPNLNYKPSDRFIDELRLHFGVKE